MNIEEIRDKFQSRKSQYGMDTHFTAKEEQLKVSLSVLNDRNVLGILPTGYGKTMCMLIPTIVCDPDNSITLVISPLTALMDQLEKIRSYNLSAAKLEPLEAMEQEIVKGIKDGQYQFVLSSPETALKSYWKDVMMSDTWQQKLSLLVVDEAHCVSDWGEEFRPDYRILQELRSIVNAPVMALTATTTIKVKNDILKYLHVDECSTDVISMQPDRPNIFLDFEMKSHRSNFESLQWLMEYLRLKKKDCVKILVFCRSINTASSLFISMKDALGDDPYVDGVHDSKHILIEMFHKSTDVDSKRRILTNLKSKDGNIKCLFATSALGMGIDISNIRMIVHLGSPKSVLSYWQEVGRCGRDGHQSYAITLFDKFSLALKTTDTDMADIVINKNDLCNRQMVMDQFIGDHEDDTSKATCGGNCKELCNCDACMCCRNCRNKCPCQANLQYTFKQFPYQSGI